LRAAIRSYKVHLRGRFLEPHLYLLALNNRGVLRIRSGEIEGVKDIVRAAIPAGDGRNELSQPMKLPAACFNLLNLLNYAFEQRPLCHQRPSPHFHGHLHENAEHAAHP
jgi:hypothetical protein